MEGVVRVMGKAPVSVISSEADGEVWKSAPRAICGIGGGRPKNMLDFVPIRQEELVVAGVPQDYDFEAHLELGR